MTHSVTEGSPRHALIISERPKEYLSMGGKFLFKPIDLNELAFCRCPGAKNNSEKLKSKGSVTELC